MEHGLARTMTRQITTVCQFPPCNTSIEREFDYCCDDHEYADGMNDDDNSNEQSFHEQMCELADDIDEKRREKEEQRVIDTLRKNREVFKAEIIDVSMFADRDDLITFTLDIPTYNPRYIHHYKLPDGDGSGERLYEVLGYLGATLRDMDMIEGMYLPVRYQDDSSWEIYLPSDRTSRWREKLSSIERPSITTVSGIIMLLSPILITLSLIIGYIFGVLVFGMTGIVFGIIVLLTAE